VLATQVSFLSSKYRRDICSYTSALTQARYSLIAHSESDYSNVLLPWSDAFPLADGVKLYNLISLSTRTHNPSTRTYNPSTCRNLDHCDDQEV
jgi:hypothetical protein